MINNKELEYKYKAIYRRAQKEESKKGSIIFVNCKHKKVKKD